MDQTTHEIRLANWKGIIEQCQSRPQGQTAKQWMKENNISEKTYYYWLRRVRARVAEELPAALPDTLDENKPTIAYAEVRAEDVLNSEDAPAIVIKTRKSTIEISSAVSGSVMIGLIKAVAHAL